MSSVRTPTIEILGRGTIDAYDAHATRTGMVHATGLEEMQQIKFGFPTAIRLADGTYLASWWSIEGDSSRTAVRWAKVRVDA